jgi:hypothetical protein
MIEPFENGHGFSPRVLRAGKPRSMCIGKCILVGTMTLKFDKQLNATSAAESAAAHAYFANLSKSASWPCAAIRDCQQAESFQPRPAISARSGPTPTGLNSSLTYRLLGYQRNRWRFLMWSGCGRNDRRNLSSKDH